MMTSNEIRDKFLKFFSARGGSASGGEDKGHKIVPSSSLVPENDSSVLFTTAGMQQFKPYYTGHKNSMSDFGSLNVVSSQKCIRTSDIEEVGDDTHLTFFEMLGNFSFAARGGKKLAIEYAYEFITKEMGLKIDYVSVFAGDDKVPFDQESFDVWKNLGIPEEKIKKLDREDNFWGPTGNEGPCGPTTEIYVNDVEIWNIVFNEYYCQKDGKLEPLEKKGVDTGMGLERLVTMTQGKNNIYETDMFRPIMEILSEVKDERVKRIIADHLRASAFMIEDGVLPSNTERGYVLRRLLRKVIKYEKNFNLGEKIYKDILKLLNKDEKILKVILEEREKFSKTLKQGLKEFEKISGTDISRKDAFILFSTYGFPIEMTEELAVEKGIKVDTEGFKREFKLHQEISRVGAEKKFKGGLAGTSPEETRLHTATHLLHQALREILGTHVEQKGSNITQERLRFDFSHQKKLTDDEIKKVESLVNEKIKDNLPINCDEMSIDEAKEKRATGSFKEKYGEKVKVYSIGEFSREICGGPHEKLTGGLGEFKIKKEEASSGGVRRIKAILKTR